MKIQLILIFIFLIALQGFSQETNATVLSQLNQAIDNKKQYDKTKEKDILLLKKWAGEASSLRQQYDFNQKIYEAYKKFISDSAIVYVKKNLQIAQKLSQKRFTRQTSIQLASLYASTGRFREAESLLEGLHSEKIADDLLADYYQAWYQFFSYYSANISSENSFDNQEEAYRDSLLLALDPSSLNYKIRQTEKNIALGETIRTENNLIELLDEVEEGSPEYAMITFLLAEIYHLKQNRELEKQYYALSAISDLKNSIKDNSSIHLLAATLFEEGNIDMAYKFSKSALEDALFCNVQFRTNYLSEFYNITNTAYQEKAEKQRSQLQRYLLLISLLSIFLIIAVIYVYKQKDKVSNIREELDLMNKKLLSLNEDIREKNNQLNDRNALLFESNQIKEEYIAHFFNMCSSYINKLEDYRKSLNKKATKGNREELFRILKSTSIIEDELAELYRNFDTIFLNLYPTFVEEFNDLLIDEEQVELKDHEKLNTELRIFALIRLGITDSVKIAAFLRYSLSTIYNYRTKARNKAAVSRDEFEKMVMKIGAIKKSEVR